MVPTGANVDFQTIWGEACARYQKITQIDTNSSTFPKPSTLEELEKAVQESNQGFQAFRERRGELFHALKAIGAPIENLGKPIADVAATSFPPSTICFGAITFLIQGARNVSGSYDVVIKLFEQLKDYVERLQIYSDGEVEITPALREKLIDILSLLLRILGRTTRLIRHGTWGRFSQFAKSLVRGQDPELDELLSTLERVTAAEHHLADTATYVEVRKMSAAVSQTQPQLEELSKRMEGLETSIQSSGSKPPASPTDSTDIEQIRSILKPSIYPADTLDFIRGSKVAGTGEWIEEDPVFKGWVHDPTPILWISGPPGSGKTFLASSIISLLTENPPSIEEGATTWVAFFFFKDSDPVTWSFGQAFNDMSHQIGQLNARYAKHVATSVFTSADISSLRSRWRKLFAEYFVSGPRGNPKSFAILILDGIDEARPEERVQFLEMLVDLQKRSSQVKVILFGRPHILEEIQDHFEDQLPTIHLENHNAVDINSYINAKVKKRRGLQASVRNRIIDTLRKKAQGMFIWTELMIREIDSLKHEEKILEALQRAPKGLDEMLYHVLEGFSAQLDEDGAADLNIMLKWVTCATQPLSIREIEALIKMESEIAGDRIDFEAQLRVDFASLFELHREDALTTADLESKQSQDNSDGNDTDDEMQRVVYSSNPETTFVVFRHTSISDFFRASDQPRIRSVPNHPSIGIDFPHAQVQVLVRCLRLICDETAPFQLRKYAGSSWEVYLRQVTAIKDDVSLSGKQEIVRYIVRMLRDEAAVGTFWVGLRSVTYFDPSILLILNTWLQDADTINSLSSDDRHWTTQVTKNNARMLWPAVRVAAREWLKGHSWPAVDAMLKMYAMLKLDQSTSVPIDPLSPANIEFLAGWAGFDRNALWHRRLATCFRDCRHFEEAKTHFEKALEMDEKMWLARSGLARLYAMQQEYKKAIDLEMKNEKTIEQSIHKPELESHGSGSAVICDLASTRFRIGTWYRALRDYSQAETYFSGAARANRYDYTAIFSSALMIHYSQERKVFDKAVIAILKGLEDRVEGKEYTRLTGLLWSFYGFDRMYFWEIANAANNQGELEWLRQAYSDAAITIKKERQPVRALYLEISCAELYLSLDKTEAAVAIWQRITSIISRPAALEIAEVYVAKARVAQRYGQYCLQQAMQADDPTSWVEELRTLCTRVSRDSSVEILPNYAALYLAIWLRRHGDEAECHRYAKPFIHLCLDLLSDDDPDNDLDSYRDLVPSLLAVGDEKTAMSVARFIRPQIRVRLMARGGAVQALRSDHVLADSVDQPVPVASPTTHPGESLAKKSNRIQNASMDHISKKAMRTYPFTDYRWVSLCWGKCRMAYPIYHQFNICRVCLTELCNPCLTSVKAGEHMIRCKCRADHDWLHVDNPDWESQTGTIILNGEALRLEEFRDRLRAQWT